MSLPKPYYEDEGISIYHADCRDILPQLKPERVDLVLTDPPYKLSQSYGTLIDADNLRNVAGLLVTLPMMSECLSEGAFLVSFYDNRILPFLFECARNVRLTYMRSVYLYRRWGQASKWGGWMQTTDPICIFRKPTNRPIAWGSGKVVHDCYIKTSPEEYDAEHPSQKPLFVVSHLLGWCSQPSGIVLDPFMGSGTTLRAAKDLGRRAIGIEIEERYCEIAAKRMAQGVLL